MKSVTLAPELDDGYLNAAEAELASEMIASLIGTGYQKAEFKIISQSEQCSGEAGFFATARLNDPALIHGQIYQVCIKLSHLGRKEPEYFTSSPFEVDTEPQLRTGPNVPTIINKWAKRLRPRVFN